MNSLKLIQDNQAEESKIFGRIGHQNGSRDPPVTPREWYQVSKTDWQGQWEPIPTLEVGQQYKWSDWRTSNATK